MQKHLYSTILLSVIFCLKGFCQAFPPVIKSYTDTVTANYCDLYLNLSPNDTGTIKVQIQLQQGTGNNVYDSTYYLPAGDTTNVKLRMETFNPCSNFDVLINLSNTLAQGSVINPLFNFTTVCTGITTLNENNYSVIAHAKSIEVSMREMIQEGVIEIYDITGKRVLITQVNQSVQQIPFNQNAGIYLLRITGNGQSLYTNRFVIN